jgi:hypothetical protein
LHLMFNYLPPPHVAVPIGGDHFSSTQKRGAT